MIIGLYIVLWGKSKETKEILEYDELEGSSPKTGQQKAICKSDDLEQPLLTDYCIEEV